MSSAIFGYDVRLGGVRPDLVARVQDELSLYPAADEDQARLDVTFVDAIPSSSNEMVNPGIHVDQEEGFVADYGSVRVQYQVGAQGRLRDVRVVPRRSSRLGDIKRRAQNIQYTTVDEMMGQLLHELVLVPAVYFQETMAPVHAAAVQAEDGTVTLIGGTGGVGKTSLELELCRRRGMRFVADDISVLDTSGAVHPNLSFPKIYGYNVEGDPALQRSLLAGSGPAGRLQWTIKKQRGAARVRRRASPVDLFGGHAQRPAPLSRYVLVVRDRAPGIEIAPLDPEVAVKMSLSVMQTEYNVFDNQVRWHEFNRHAWGRAPLLAMENVLERWAGVYRRAFRDAECLLLRASKDLSHKEFLARAADLVTAPSGRGAP